MTSVKTGSLPILYSFRRCPYAIRARLALRVAGVAVELREVSLRQKPAAMITLSPKATVPVLQLPDVTVLEESLDIMLWALGQRDGDGWLAAVCAPPAVPATSASPTSVGSDSQNPVLPGLLAPVQALIARNDGPFKGLLDRYKYANRHPEFPQQHYRDEAVALHLTPLDVMLAVQVDAVPGNAPGVAPAIRGPGLLGAEMSLLDAAIFPFVRQFAAVDPAWFASAPLPALRAWLARWQGSALFQAVMEKGALWKG